VSGYSLVYSKSLGGQLGPNAHGRPSTIYGSSSFVSADDVSLVSFQKQTIVFTIRTPICI